MANKKISELSSAGALTGTESVEIVQGGANVKTTTQDIADLGGGGGGGGTWGSITGTLSSQTDLQSALNAKLNAIPTIVDGGTNYTLQSSDLALITAGATLIIEGDETGTLTIPLDATVDFPDNCIIGFRGFILVAVTGGITETHTNDSLDCDPGLEFTWSLEKRATNTWNISNGTAGGGGGGTTYTFTASDFNESGTTISIDYTNGQAASASTKGFLTSADYTSFAGNDLVSASVSTSGGTITLDMDSKKQKMFVGSATFSASKTMAISNSTAALTFSFSFEVTDVAATIVLPSTWLMGDVYWNSATDTWTPPATGKYLMVGSYNGTNWFITIAGPFN